MRPVFNRAPLVPNESALPSIGRIRPEGWLGEGAKNALSALKSVERAVSKRDTDAGVCAFYRDLELLSGVLSDAEGMKSVAGFISRIIKTRREDGFFGPEAKGDLTAQFECLNLLYEYFTCTSDKAVLGIIDGFLRWEYLNLRNNPLRGESVYRGGENIYVALKMYNLSGQKYLTELCAILREQTFDWVSEFNTFPQIRPISQVMAWEDLKKGLEAEKARGGGNCTSLFRRAHGKNVAMALKTPALLGLLRPGFRETQAFGAGWSRLMRLHGALNGMFTCDDLLDGARDAGTLSEAAAEALWSLDVLGELDEGNREIAPSFEKIACNMLPAMFSRDGKAAQRIQKGNQTSASAGSEKFYNASPADSGFVSVDDDMFALNGIARGWAFAARGLWCHTADGGLKAASYFPCQLAAAIDKVKTRIRVSGGYPFADEVVIGISAEREVEFPLYLRVPSWAENPVICLPGGEIMAVKAGETTCLRQKWDKSGEIRLELNTRARPRPFPGGLMGVMYGPVIMALEPQAENDGQNLRLPADAPTKTLGDNGAGRIPETLVKLKNESNEQVTRTLVPYAFTEKRICAFAQARTEENDA